MCYGLFQNYLKSFYIMCIVMLRLLGVITGIYFTYTKRISAIVLSDVLSLFTYIIKIKEIVNHVY